MTDTRPDAADLATHAEVADVIAVNTRGRSSRCPLEHVHHAVRGHIRMRGAAARVLVRRGRGLVRRRRVLVCGRSCLDMRLIRAADVVLDVSSVPVTMLDTPPVVALRGSGNRECERSGYECARPACVKPTRPSSAASSRCSGRRWRRSIPRPTPRARAARCSWPAPSPSCGPHSPSSSRARPPPSIRAPSPTSRTTRPPPAISRR